VVPLFSGTHGLMNWQETAEDVDYLRRAGRTNISCRAVRGGISYCTIK